MLRAVLIVLSFAFTVTLSAQTPHLTWLRHYKTAQDVRMLREPLDKLLAEKKIVRWGVLAPYTYIGDPWTQIVYVSAPDWASLESVGIALDVVRPANPTDIHDVILRHTFQSEGPAAFRPKFVVMNRHPVARGKDSDAFALFDEWAKPIFLDLQKRNKVGPWAQMIQSFVLDNEWTYLVWYFLPDLGALDDVTSSLGGLGISQLGTFERRLRDMSEDDYRAQIMRVVYASP